MRCLSGGLPGLAGGRRDGPGGTSTGAAGATILALTVCTIHHAIEREDHAAGDVDHVVLAGVDDGEPDHAQMRDQHGLHPATASGSGGRPARRSCGNAAWIDGNAAAVRYSALVSPLSRASVSKPMICRPSLITSTTGGIDALLGGHPRRGGGQQDVDHRGHEADRDVRPHQRVEADRRGASTRRRSRTSRARRSATCTPARTAPPTAGCAPASSHPCSATDGDVAQSDHAVGVGLRRVPDRHATTSTSSSAIP